MNTCRFGTDLFLLLSGCLIHRSVRSTEHGFGVYLLRRGRRIYPVFLLVLTVYLTVLYPLERRAPPDHWKIIQNVTILPLLVAERPIILVSWTLGYICAFYILAYPLIRTLRKHPYAFRLLTWALIAVAVYALRGRAYLLPVGVLLSKLIDRSEPRLLWACGFIAARAVLPPNVALIPASIGAFVLCWWLLTRTAPRGAAQKLSQLSYPFYLTHGLAILLVARLNFDVWKTLLIALPLAVVASALVHVTIERPATVLSSGEAANNRPIAANKEPVVLRCPVSIE